MNDLISVIIPVRNGEKYLQEALDGIKNQDMNTEIIVVDDFSDDNTVQIAQNNKCKLIKHNKHKGPVAGKNSGIKESNGKYILFHDSDDIMTDGALSKMYQELTEDKILSAVEAKITDFYSPELSETERKQILIKNEPYWGLFTGAILMKKDIFDKIGLFDDSLKAGEILDWYSRINTYELNIKKIDFVSVKRRIHLSNFGRVKKENEFKNYTEILRAKIKGKI